MNESPAPTRVLANGTESFAVYKLVGLVPFRGADMAIREWRSEVESGTLLASKEVSRHKCLVYDGHASEQLPVVIPLLMDGLHDNWRCLYLGSPVTVHMVESALVNRGVDPAEEQRRGALVLSSDRSHLVNGVFDPRAMVDGLGASIDQAVRDGFEGLCATGDMRWELGSDDNFDRLLEYEALLEQLFRDKPLRGICQYHREIVPAEAVRDALLTHRSAYVGQVLNRENLFYVPPELLLAENRTSAAQQGEWMCQQILRVLKAERARDAALAALAASNRDLERRVAERTAQLEVANRDLEAFSYSVSHDLRAPLRAIVGFGQILAEDSDDRLDENGRESLEQIRASARHMQALIEGLIEMARVAKEELCRRDVDISALVETVVGQLRGGDPRRSVEVVVAPGLRSSGDPILLRAAMTNLLGNAWKFTSKRAAARIEVGRNGEDAGMPVFFVRDNGAGFDMRYAQKLFGAFQRLHRQDEFPGTGVGLATVERIVARHGGRIWAESRPDEGATFFFTLPHAGGAEPPATAGAAG